MGITAMPGGRLLVLDGLHPAARCGNSRRIGPAAFGGRTCRSMATRTLLLQAARREELSPLRDGSGRTGPRQLTDSDYDDIDPIYLPDGHILFTTTRGNSHVRCGPFIYSYILARCDGDGRNVYLISYNGEPDYRARAARATAV